MARSARTPTLSLLLALGLALSPVHAFAQTDEQRAAARDLATDGADAFDQGRYEDAIDRFNRAEALVHATPHLLYLARAHAKLRQYVKSREAYMKIINEPVAANAPGALRDAHSAALGEISIVESKIGRLTVRVEGKEQAKDLVVQVNGAAIPSVLVGAPQPVDPGEHQVDAIATGFRAEAQSVAVAEGEQKQIVLKLVADPTAVSPAAADTPPEPAATPPPSGPPVDQPPPESGGSSGMRVGSYVAFGVGAVGLGLGTVFLLQSSSKRSEADDLCTLPDGACDRRLQPEIDQLDSDADSAATIGVAGLVLGGVGIATGVTLFVLSSGGGSRTGDARPKGVRVAPLIGPRTLGVAGVF